MSDVPDGVPDRRRFFVKKDDGWSETTLREIKEGDLFSCIDEEVDPSDVQLYRATGAPSRSESGVWVISAEVHKSSDIKH